MSLSRFLINCYFGGDYFLGGGYFGARHSRGRYFNSLFSRSRLIFVLGAGPWDQETEQKLIALMELDASTQKIYEAFSSEFTKSALNNNWQKKFF